MISTKKNYEQNLALVAWLECAAAGEQGFQVASDFVRVGLRNFTKSLWMFYKVIYKHCYVFLNSFVIMCDVILIHV